MSSHIISKPMGLVDKIVRDHLYDETRPGGPREKKGITVGEMLTDVDNIRQRTTDAGAIRRSLKNIESHGLLTRKPAGGGRAFSYKWEAGEKIPSDYVSRPLKATTPQGSAVTSPQTLTSQQKHANLNSELEGRMSEISDEKIEHAKRMRIPTSRPPKMAPVLRPNGEKYLPRELAGIADVHTVQQLREEGLYLLLAGPPGGGKTALLEASFADTEGGLHIITGDAGTKVSDFLGQWYPTGKPDEMYWSDGPLVLAMRAGGVLFVDDATLIDTKEIACMYPAMDGRRTVLVKEHPVEVNGVMQPDVVEAQPGFFVVAAHNPGVPGAILSEALSSRFTAQVWLESDLDLANALGVSSKATKLARNMRTRRDNGEYGIFVPEMRELIAFRNFSKKFGEFAACENLLGKAPGDFQDEFAVEIKTAFGWDTHPRKLEVKGQL